MPILSNRVATPATIWRKLILIALLVGGIRAQSGLETVAASYGHVRICDNGDPGYNTIEDLNGAVKNELSKIQPGDPPPAEPYVFVLCPSRIYNVTSVPFSTTLSNLVVTCGAAGIPDGSDGQCEFQGGEESVRLDTEGQHLTLIGMTFTNFNTASITGNASSSSTVELIRSNFENFKAESAIVQANADGKQPFNVIIDSTRIRDAEAGTLFSNVGGEMTVANAVIEGGAALDSIVTTSSTNSSEGTTFLRQIKATNSSVNNLFVVGQSADIDAIGIDVQDMNYLDTVFRIDGTGTSATVDDVIVVNNDISRVDSHVWSGFVVDGGGVASFSNLTFCNNSNVWNVASAMSGSSMEINKAKVCGLSGGSVVDDSQTGDLFVNTGARLSLEDVDIAGGLTLYDSVVATIAADSSNGTTIMRDITTTTSSVNNLFIVDGAATIDAVGVTVNNMQYMESVFSIDGAASYATVADLTVQDNILSGIDSHLWSGMNVAAMGQASFSNVTFCNNTKVRHMATAALGSQLSLDKVKVCDVIGDSTVDGNGSSIVLNGGGGVTISDIDVSDVDGFGSLLTVSNDGSNSSSAVILGASATSSSISNLFVVENSSTLSAQGIRVDSMNNMDTVFSIKGPGSLVNAHSIEIVDNDLSGGSDSHLWTGLSIADNGHGSFSNFTFCNNSHIRHVAEVNTESSIGIDTAKVCDVSGGRSVNTNGLSAVAFVNGRSTADIERMTIEDVVGLTATVFVNDESHADLTRSCVRSGEGQAAVYLSEESTYMSNDNFLENFTSVVCNEQGDRLVQETPGSGCFESGRSDCAFNCTPFFRAASCQVNVTDAPSSYPSISTTPSFSPSTTPSISAVPTSSSHPSDAPSASSQPSTAPTTSSSPTLSSAPSFLPSFSAEPSTFPTVSSSPSISPSTSSQPSFTPTLSWTSLPSIFPSASLSVAATTGSQSQSPSTSPSTYPISASSQPTSTSSSPLVTDNPDCGFLGAPVVLLPNLLTTRQVIDPVSEIVTVELRLAGTACLAFAFTENCDNTGRVSYEDETIVVAMPEEGSVLKYNIHQDSGTDSSVLDALSANQQTLISASILQSDDLTVLAFSRPLVDGSEAMVPIEGPACFIYSVGSDNKCSSFPEWRKETLLISQCGSTPTPTQTPIQGSTVPSVLPSTTPSSQPSTESPTLLGETRPPSTMYPSLNPTRRRSLSPSGKQFEPLPILVPVQSPSLPPKTPSPPSGSSNLSSVFSPVTAAPQSTTSDDPPSSHSEILVPIQVQVPLPNPTLKPVLVPSPVTIAAPTPLLVPILVPMQVQVPLPNPTLQPLLTAPTPLLVPMLVPMQVQVPLPSPTLQPVPTAPAPLLVPIKYPTIPATDPTAIQIPPAPIPSLVPVPTSGLPGKPDLVPSLTTTPSLSTRPTPRGPVPIALIVSREEPTFSPVAYSPATAANPSASLYHPAVSAGSPTPWIQANDFNGPPQFQPTYGFPDTLASAPTSLLDHYRHKPHGVSSSVLELFGLVPPSVPSKAPKPTECICYAKGKGMKMSKNEKGEKGIYAAKGKVKRSNICKCGGVQNYPTPSFSQTQPSSGMSSQPSPHFQLSPKDDMFHSNSTGKQTANDNTAMSQSIGSPSTSFSDRFHALAKSELQSLAGSCTCDAPDGAKGAKGKSGAKGKGGRANVQCNCSSAAAESAKGKGWRRSGHRKYQISRAFHDLGLGNTSLSDSD